VGAFMDTVHQGLRREVGNLIRDVIVNGVFASPIIPPQIRWRLLRSVGLHVARAYIAPSCYFGSGSIIIGSGVFINRECFFDGAGVITIGTDVRIGMRCLFVTGTHEVGPSSKRAGVATSRPIEVGAGSWIGANATVLPGVRIGRGAVVGAGAVVAADVADDAFVAGVPARAIDR
jgi:maltose O-acetyltransferase